MIETILAAGCATVYWVFVFTAKRGPFDVFARARALARRLPPILAYHLTCRTCLALSVGTVMLIAAHTPAAPLVWALAVAGITVALHGMAGYWHQPDDPEYQEHQEHQE